MKAVTVLIFCINFLFSQQQLNLYNWNDYIDIDILKEFSAKTGIQIRYDLYYSNEEMYQNITQNIGKYDILFPSAHYVEKLVKDGLLQELNLSKIDINSIDERFTNLSFDKYNSYSIPYLWGSSGILVDTKKCGNIKKWADLWSEKCKGLLLLHNDMRDMFAMALLSLGYSANSRDKSEIKEAYQKLLELIPNIKTISSQSLHKKFLKGGYYIGTLYNGDAFVISENSSNLSYIYPEDGVIMWIDNIVIPKDAPNKDSAYQFINFLMQPEISARISKSVGYATANKNSYKFLDSEFQNNKIIYPNLDSLKNSEILLDTDDVYNLYSEYFNLFIESAKAKGVIYEE